MIIQPAALPASPPSAARRRARPGFALLTVIVVLVGVASLLGLFYTVTSANVRRARFASRGSATQYAAEAGLRTFYANFVGKANKGFLIGTDSADIANGPRPSITDITYTQWALTSTPITITRNAPSLSEGPFKTAKLYGKRYTMTVQATATGAEPSTTILRQDIDLEMLPFHQAALTAFADVEIYSDDATMLSVVNGYAYTIDTVAAIRSSGSVYYDTPNFKQVFGGMYLNGTVLQRRKYDLTSTLNTPFYYYTNSNATARYTLIDSVRAAQSGYSVQDSLDLMTTMYMNRSYTRMRDPMPTQPVYPPCDGVQGLFGLRCRSTSTVTPTSADTVDVGAITAAQAGNGIIYLRPQTSRGFIALKNTQSLPQSLTIVSEVPVMLSDRGWNTTGTWRPSAIIAPRVYVAKPATGDVYIYAVLVAGYQPSPHNGGAGSYAGGTMEAIPAVVDGDWGDGAVGYPKQALSVEGAVIAWPISATWGGSPRFSPTRIYNYDARLSAPANWPPGLPGRYRLTLRSPRIVPQ